MEETKSITETRLVDWKRSPFQITDIHLKFELDEKITHVTSVLKIQAAEDRLPEEALVLNGEDIKLLSLIYNGKKLDETSYSIDGELLTLHPQESEFVLEITTEIYPEKNTHLAGLYKSEEILCTQNEAEGFRRITYFIDRPDIMARYFVEIIADKKKYPYLLSNGNLIESGDLANGRHYAKWQDPFLKPCYLFALVAGDFGLVEDTYMTKSGRSIDLKIYCDHGNEGQCAHAMTSLKAAMLWDEETFGLEYDLDLFMIVAVLSFNFGAMENKGLNIFNANAILADNETSTDDNFMRIERVVAHEYFHNWTGNRVTLRDWFQLTLKEGFTVYRDQEFMKDRHSRGVQRIEDVYFLRRYQFPEDSGPTHHPIKPDSYIKIDNFYTSTIYQKGAEVIGMVKTLLGKERFQKGMDIYFERYDGMAVTTEDFLSAMEMAYGESIDAFKRWYHQSGTPVIEVKKVTSEKGFALEIVQISDPLMFPMSVGFIDKGGKPVGNPVLLKVEKERKVFRFNDVPSDAVMSLNRGFSAPIIVKADLSKEERLLLMGYDTDAYTRWDAAYELYLHDILKMNTADTSLLTNIETILKDDCLEPAYKALMLTLPSEVEAGERQEIIAIDEIHKTRELFKESIGKTHYGVFLKIWNQLTAENDLRIDTKAMGKRKLKNCALNYLVASKEQEAFSLAYKQFLESKTMTDQLAALELLAYYENPYREQALEAFYENWQNNPLVITKWFAAQSGSQNKDTYTRVCSLLKNESYDEKVPNNVRALLGTFVQNQVHFHDITGRGYQLISEQVIHLDKINPYVAAGLVQGFKKFAKLDARRKELMRQSLEEILKVQDLSPNVYEIASKCLG